jgi:hypothetical protein
MELLYENLSTEQRDILRSLGYFEVIRGETGRTYRIRSAYCMNMEEISARGTRMCLMCFCPNGRVGLGDISGLIAEPEGLRSSVWTVVTRDTRRRADVATRARLRCSNCRSPLEIV